MSANVSSSRIASRFGQGFARRPWLTLRLHGAHEQGQHVFTTLQLHAREFVRAGVGMDHVLAGVVDGTELEREIEMLARRLLDGAHRPATLQGLIHVRFVHRQAARITDHFEQHGVIRGEATVQVLVVNRVGDVHHADEVHFLSGGQGERPDRRLQPGALRILRKTDVVRQRLRERSGGDAE